MKQLIVSLICSITLLSCSGSNYIRNKEARDDAKKMAEALALQAKVPHKIVADAETTPVKGILGEDAADDPAIWYNYHNPQNSVIIGTDKNAGLYTYNLEGDVLDFVSTGEVNNVDVRDGFPYKDSTIVLVSATNRTTQGISFFELNPNTGKLSEKIGEIKGSGDDIYGYTMYKDEDRFYAIANSKDGLIQQFLLEEVNGEIKGETHRSLRVISQPEGMVVDEETNTLYVGVEEFYIQLFGAKANDNVKRAPQFIESSTAANNPFIAYDIEGLALLPHNGKTYLIASIQGSFSYAIFDVTNADTQAEYITSFAIGDNVDKQIDGAEETDGLEICNKPMGDNYPSGILVVQDGFNKNGEKDETQNFKIIDLRKVIDLLP